MFGQNDKLNLSIQLSKPKGGSAGSSTGSADNIVDSVECSSIRGGLDLFNSYISRRLTLSHCKVLVISEELASKGISEYIYTLLNDVEMSVQASVIISKSPAHEFLASSEPVLEDLASKYYEIAINSNEYTGFTQNVTLIKFFSDYVDTFKEPVAILGGVNLGTSNQATTPDATSSGSVQNANSVNSQNSTQSQSQVSLNSSSQNYAQNSSNDSSQSNNPSVPSGSATASFANKDNSYTAGSTPVDSKPNIENMGLAVFKGDRLVGEMTGIESIFHLIVSSNLKSCNISIPNPLGDSSTLDINLKLGKSTKNDVEFVNGSPLVTCKINVNIQIVSTTEKSSSGSSSYYTPENSKLIEETCNDFLKKNILEYLYKTSKNYKSDIDGFGKHAVKYFTTMQEWNDYDWLDNYENSIFDVEVDSTLKSGYTFL